MVKSSKKTLINKWLKARLLDRQNGIIVAEPTPNHFESIQDFIEANDRSLQTPAIYYQAFPEESAAEFLEVLTDELTSKFGSQKFNSSQSLAEITSTVGLRMVIIDCCYLHPLDTFYEILDRLTNCEVATILIGSYCNLKIAQILEYPNIDRWERLILDECCEIAPKKS